MTNNKRSIYYESFVTVFENRQFITGKEPKPGGNLPDIVYSQALDSLVIGCVDIIPTHNGQMLIGLRSWEPQADWWCFGGRMHKGELFQIAAARNTKRELFHNVEGYQINPSRFTLVGVYNLIWDKRAQAPVENGSHVISVTMRLPLTDDEAIFIRPDEEYREIRWIRPGEIIHGPGMYHPCLVQIAKDLTNLMHSTKCNQGTSAE